MMDDDHVAIMSNLSDRKINPHFLARQPGGGVGGHTHCTNLVVAAVAGQISSSCTVTGEWG